MKTKLYSILGNIQTILWFKCSGWHLSPECGCTILGAYYPELRYNTTLWRDLSVDYNNDKSVTLGELVPYLSEKVCRATKNAQCPEVAGKFDPAMILGK